MTATDLRPSADAEQRLHDALRAYRALADALLAGPDFAHLTTDTHATICDLVTAGYKAFDPADLVAAELPPGPPGARVDELRRLLQRPDPVPADIFDEVLASRALHHLLHVIAQRADLTQDLVERIMPFTNTALLNDLAANPNTPATTMRILVTAGIGRSSTFVKLAQNPSLPADLLDTFMSYPAYVRVELAARPDLPEDLARELAGDSIEAVREAVARNPHMPDDVRVLAALSLPDDEGSR
jgi:hypothetical protein